MLFVACRGSGHRIVARYGPRIGLTDARVHRVAAVAEARGLAGLAVGRATPGLRTLTVVAAGVSGLNGRRALPALILGSSVFLQLHLVLGLLLGPLADRAFDQAKGPAVAAAAVLTAGAFLFWRARRRNRAPAAWTEAACPACLGARALAERVPGLTGLVPGQAAAPGTSRSATARPPPPLSGSSPMRSGSAGWSPTGPPPIGSTCTSPGTPIAPPRCWRRRHRSRWTKATFAARQK
jgi:hypothetical protein